MEIKIKVGTYEGEKIMILSNEYFDNFNFVDMYFDKASEGENEEQPESSTEVLNVYTVPVEEEIKGLKKQPIVKDPKVEERKAIIGYFIRKSKEIHGYCPQISLVPTLKLIKTLQSFNSEVDLRELIDWFLQSDLYDNLGSDIKICFSLASYNKFMDYKRKH